MPTGPCQGKPCWAGAWQSPLLGALGAGVRPQEAGGWVADLCFHLISSVVFQELWQDPEGWGRGGETSGRRHGSAAIPHVTPLADDSAAWKGLEASVL